MTYELSVPADLMTIGRNWPRNPADIANALELAFPSYTVRVFRYGSGPVVYELITNDDSNPWCLISHDAREIWRELTQS